MAIKILIGGSPCTYWSIAQKNNRETEASGTGWELFKNYLIAKEKFKPDFFLYENNKSAAQAIKDQIAEELGVGVDPDVRFTYINSALVSAQNRQRFYVTNFGDIEQPEDRGILLKDILETGSNLTPDDKAFCLTASYNGACAWNTIERSQRSMVAEPVQVWPLPRPNGELSTSQAMRVYSIEGKGVTQSAGGGGLGGKTGLYAIPVNETTNGKAQTIKAQYHKTSAANICCYSSTYGASGVAESIGYATPCEWDENGKPTKAISRADGKTYPVYEVCSFSPPHGWNNGIFSYEKFPNITTGSASRQQNVLIEPLTEENEHLLDNPQAFCNQKYEVKDSYITIKGKQYPIKLVDGYYIIRKLTVSECARLQTMPDDYCKAVSDSQAYKALGNGWTAEVIIHLLNHALKDVQRDEEIVVLSMYDGIATGRYCLDKMGFTNVKYHAYEIDKYPIQVAMDNYPDIIQHGDAFAVREDDWKPPQTRSEWLDELLGA